MNANAVLCSKFKHGGFAQFLSRLQCYESTVMLLELVQALKSHCCSQLLTALHQAPDVQLDLQSDPNSIKLNAASHKQKYCLKQVLFCTVRVSGITVLTIYYA